MGIPEAIDGKGCPPYYRKGWQGRLYLELGEPTVMPSEIIREGIPEGIKGDLQGEKATGSNFEATAVRADQIHKNICPKAREEARRIEEHFFAHYGVGLGTIHD